MPAETFNDPNRGLDRDARVDRLSLLLADFDSDAPPRPASVGDWPRIQTAIRRGDLFVVETSTPIFMATLRFCPERPDAGDYQIHHRPRGGIERGHTVKVVPVSADATDTRVTMLTPFPTRYVIATVGSERPHARIVWLVGLRDFRLVDEKDLTDDGAA